MLSERYKDLLLSDKLSTLGCTVLFLNGKAGRRLVNSRLEPPSRPRTAHADAVRGSGTPKQCAERVLRDYRGLCADCALSKLTQDRLRSMSSRWTHLPYVHREVAQVHAHIPLAILLPTCNTVERF